MSVATFPVDRPPVLNRLTEDRALGTTGGALRTLVANAMSLPDDRGSEIYTRVVRALTRAREEDGTLVSPETFGRTLELLNLLPRGIPLPDVVVENEKEIGLDWDEGARRALTLTVRDSSLVGFSALFGVEPMYGRTIVAGEIPQTLRFLLARLYQHVPGTRSTWTVRF